MFTILLSFTQNSSRKIETKKLSIFISAGFAIANAACHWRVSAWKMLTLSNPKTKLYCIAAYQFFFIWWLHSFSFYFHLAIQQVFFSPSFNHLQSSQCTDAARWDQLCSGKMHLCILSHLRFHSDICASSMMAVSLGHNTSPIRHRGFVISPCTMWSMCPIIADHKCKQKAHDVVPTLDLTQRAHVMRRKRPRQSVTAYEDLCVYSLQCHLETFIEPDYMPHQCNHTPMQQDSVSVPSTPSTSVGIPVHQHLSASPNSIRLGLLGV